MATIQQASEYIRAGKLAEARAELTTLLQQNPNSDQVWLLLSFAVTERSRQIECVQRAIKLNPQNANAKARLEKLTGSVQPPSIWQSPAQPSTPGKPATPSSTTSAARRSGGGGLSERLSSRQGDSAASAPGSAAPDSSLRDLFGETRSPAQATSPEPSTFKPAAPKAESPQKESFGDSSAINKPTAEPPSPKKPAKPFTTAALRNELLNDPKAVEPDEPPDWMRNLDPSAGEGPTPSATVRSEPKPLPKRKTLDEDQPPISFDALTQKPNTKGKKKSKPAAQAFMQEGSSRFRILLVMLLVLIGLLAVGLYLGWPYLMPYLPGFGLQFNGQPTDNAISTPAVTEAIAAIPTSTPTPKSGFAGLPPTWTLTFTPIPSSTAKAAIPTLSPTATLPLPGPTILADLNTVQQQIVKLRGLEIQTEIPGYIAKRSDYLNRLNTIYTDDYLLKLRYQGWMLKALGLLTDDFDWSGYVLSSNQVNWPSIYVPWEKQLLLFETRFEGKERFAYVHEFARALIDHYYPYDTLGGSLVCIGEAQQCAAVRALVEGDATLVMYQWWKEFAASAKQNDFWYFTPPTGLASGQTPPSFAGPDFMFVYDYGYEFAKTLYARGGWKGINQAYSNLPTTSEQILHPDKYLAGEGAIPVSDPSLDGLFSEGWTKTGDQSLGEWFTYLVLGYGAYQQIQLEDKIAKDAATGWGGDHLVVYRNISEAKTAMVVHWVWDTQAVATQFQKVFLEYQGQRFPNAYTSDRGRCQFIEEQVSCLLTQAKESVWILVPSLELVKPLMDLYPDYR